jgi:hypothetical protein
MKPIEKLHQCLISRRLISFSSSSIVFGMAPPYSPVNPAFFISDAAIIAFVRIVSGWL